MNWFEALQLKNLRVGSVIFTWCDFVEPDPKGKFLVVASIEPSFLVLVINSEINQFFVENGTDKYHVVIPLVDHDFLRHDSYANCLDAKNCFDLTHVKDEMLKDYNGIHKGHLSLSVLNDVYEAVDEQRLMRRGHKREILESLLAEIKKQEE
jgi:hypothetical protein